MTGFVVGTTLEDHLRANYSQLNFMAGHMALVLQLFKELYEAGSSDYQEVYARATSMLEMYEARMQQHAQS